jgi:tetratricopeptide (TPR) repeat protein
MTRAFDLLQAGSAAVKAKQFEQAEEYLFAAHQMYNTEFAGRIPRGLDPRLTVAFVLAKVYRTTGRYEDAINALEKSIPLQGAFGELARIFRFLGKAAKKEGDLPAMKEWYRRMYCVAKMNAAIATLRLPDVPHPIDWARATHWLADVRSQCGTLYAFQWDGLEVPNDTILSATDYKTIRAINSSAQEPR